MTGFASTDTSVEIETGQFDLSWDLKTVNAKGLDVRLRLPQALERLEQDVKKRISKALKRGSVFATLSLNEDKSTSRLRVNQAGLMAANTALQQIANETGAKLPDAAAILNIKGVAEWGDSRGLDSNQTATLSVAVLKALDKTLADLKQARETEGQHLKTVLMAQLDTIADLKDAIERHPSHTPEAMRERIKRQMALVMDENTALDRDHLHQEAAQIAIKADLREELDRLNAHIAAGRDFLMTGGAIGRRLDFLAQEFNREANTICSKSNSAAVSGFGVDLKVVIDQLREQVQNVE